MVGRGQKNLQILNISLVNGFKVANIVALKLSYFFKLSYFLIIFQAPRKATNSTVNIKLKIFTLLNFI